MKKSGTLLLLPNVLGEVKHHEPFLPASVDKAVATLDGLISESEKGGRRFLGRFTMEKRPHDVPLALLNEHSSIEDIDFLLEPVRQGERWGVVSDGGLPCIADPGSMLVHRAKQLGVKVQAFSGPSSLMLSLMLSGLPAQRFTFHGYLPKAEEDRAAAIKKLEGDAVRSGYTQIFIEVPYRNMNTLETLLSTLKRDTLLCIAWELTLPEQGVLTQTVENWKKSPLPNLEKRNAIFIVGAQR